MPDETPKKLVFLSYRGEDSGTAAQLAAGLTAAGVPVWRDKEQIRAGDRWVKALEQALSSCGAYVALVGKMGVDRWMRLELDIALSRHISEEQFRIVPVLLNQVQADSLPPFLTQFQAVSYQDSPENQDRAAFFDRLATVLAAGSTAAGAAVDSSVCPFPGLNPFDESLSPVFFGRHSVTLDLLGRIGSTPTGHRRWLQIEGPSGSGKSSVLQAGLIPSVRKRWVEGVKGPWCIVVVRPGTDPVRSLARGFARALADAGRPIATADLEGRLNSSPNGLRNVFDDCVPQGYAVLLAIDQFEELSTLAPAVPSLEKALAPIDALLGCALQDRELPLYLVTTIRSDFVGQFRHLTMMAAQLNTQASRYYLQPLSGAELIATITEPARLAGLKWEPGLVERIVEDAASAEGGVPMLAHVLRALWEQRDGNVLTHSKYKALGGVVGALSNGADRLIATLGPPGGLRAKNLLLSLVRVGRGGANTRRTITRDYALAAAGGGQQAERILARLSGGRDEEAPADAVSPPRLIVVTRETEGDLVVTDRVDLIHEALMERWNALRTWIEESRRGLECREDLETASRAWESAGRPGAGLPAGAMLAYYEQAAIPAGTEPDFLTEARRRRKLRKQLTAALAAIAAIAVLFLLNRVRRQENYLQALAAYQTAEGASREAETLWPAGTGYADRMKQWVEKASRLSAAAPRYKALLATLAADDQHRDEIARLIEILQGFGNSERGEISAIQRRLERASRIVSDPDLASRWKAAMAAVASNPRYSGLQLQPQFGLSPLGMDRHSGLEEFADWRTGEAPARGGNGELQIDENSALIFVLVPGGTFRMGEEHGNPADQYDRPLAYEGPVNSVTLSPFFISKYEMSQGQWLRVTGTNPSKYNPQNGAAYRITLLNPVEQVSWNDCDLLFSHLHLAIPTEAQWEYATRGGTTTPWWTGATSASLDGKANVDGTRDGYEKHAPINAFPPNPFGLYNVHGNVWEWCRDFYSTTSYRYPVRPGDGLRMLTGDQRVFRGGGYDDNANFSRSSYRYGYKPNFNFDVAGVRPSREIQPD